MIDVRDNHLDAQTPARGLHSCRQCDRIGAAATRDERAFAFAKGAAALDCDLDVAFRPRPSHERRTCRAISRCTSRLASSARLSHSFFPRATPSSTLAIPRVK